ncbi:MAG: radical SAM protein [Myxococcaceae bacterium]
MRAMNTPFEPERRPEADSVVVREIFLSVQGESSHAGKLCSFVRLTGCHLRCTYCDTDYAFEGGARMKVSEVLAKVAELGSNLVEVTGGEPLLQAGVYPLLDGLLAAGHTVMLETSGAIDVRLVPPSVHKIVDLKTPSSGECERNDYRVLDSMNGNDELKFVVGSREDYEWSRALVQERSLATRPYGLLFSAVAGKLEPTLLAEWIIADRLPVRFQMQLHKLLWGPDRRGV